MTTHILKIDSEILDNVLDIKIDSSLISNNNSKEIIRTSIMTLPCKYYKIINKIANVEDSKITYSFSQPDNTLTIDINLLGGSRFNNILQSQKKPKKASKKASKKSTKKTSKKSTKKSTKKIIKKRSNK